MTQPSIAALYVETDGAYCLARWAHAVAARNGTPRIHTPPAFRDLLISIARSAHQQIEVAA